MATSRSQLTPLVAAEGAFPLTLDVLAEADAHELLARRVGAERVAGDLPAADELIQLCAGLPLALSIAAARSASQPGLSLAALSAELRGAGGRLDALDAGDAATNVRAVLSWSYQQLNASAGRLFRLLGLHAGPDISAAAATRLADLPPDDARRTLGELTRAHLLFEYAPGRFASHDLLRAYAAELTQSEDSADERRAAIGRMLDHYLHTAASAALQLHPTRRPVTLVSATPGATPEYIGERRAGAGLVPGRTPGPDGGRRPGRGDGLRCARLADPVGDVPVPGHPGPLARVDHHRADRAGRRRAAGRPGRPGGRAAAVRLRQRPARQLRRRLPAAGRRTHHPHRDRRPGRAGRRAQRAGHHAELPGPLRGSPGPCRTGAGFIHG